MFQKLGSSRRTILITKMARKAVASHCRFLVPRLIPFLLGNDQNTYTNFALKRTYPDLYDSVFTGAKTLKVHAYQTMAYECTMGEWGEEGEIGMGEEVDTLLRLLEMHQHKL